jgi:DNA invertase Pin-like site-specific DNA recombinase
MSKGKRIGYIRVSTIDQNPDRQLEGIELDKKFIDHASAKSTDRPQLKNMLEFVREDDTVIIHSMDRLARNLFDLRNLVDSLVKQKIQVHFIKENLVFNGSDCAMSNLLLSLMGAFAEFEYAFIKERQREGIAVAKKQGKFKGSKFKLDDEKIELLKKRMKSRDSKSQIAEEFGISRFTLYRYLEKIQNSQTLVET